MGQKGQRTLSSKNCSLKSHFYPSENCQRRNFCALTTTCLLTPPHTHLQSHAESHVFFASYINEKHDKRQPSQSYTGSCNLQSLHWKVVGEEILSKPYPKLKTSLGTTPRQRTSSRRNSSQMIQIKFE